MIVLFLFSLLVAIHCPTAESWDKTKVKVPLYGQVILPCSFPFMRGREGVTVVWEKMDKDGKRSIAHMFKDGQDILADQDINYTERTELSGEFSWGNVDLKIRNVTVKDVGTYCRAVNGRGQGDKEVELTISDHATVTVVHIDGKKRLKCINIGVFGNPWPKWYNAQGEDLSGYGTRNIHDLGGGRKMMEFVLDLDVETNIHYVCQVKEGRLKRSVRAVISDKTEVEVPLYGQVILPCSFPFIRGREGLEVVWEKKDKDGKSLFAHKFIDGQDILADQHINYTERTELSREFSRGNVDLILRNVTFNDAGTYYCHAVNRRGYGDKEVELTISDKTKVKVPLYGQVILPCSFRFIRGRKGLEVVWEKKDKDGNRSIAHKVIDGQDILENHDINYTNRTELSRELFGGNADLKIRGVTFNDEGTYLCHAVNGRGYGDKEVELTISDDVTVTVVHIDGKKRLKCIDNGVFRDPKVKWYDIEGEDLSEYGTRNITDVGGGRKKVESVLDFNVETNKQYICQVTEERLKRSVRAVISDGEPVKSPEIKLPE